MIEFAFEKKETADAEFAEAESCNNERRNERRE